jgi:hypothetical protein
MGLNSKNGLEKPTRQRPADSREEAAAAAAAEEAVEEQ